MPGTRRPTREPREWINDVLRAVIAFPANLSIERNTKVKKIFIYTPVPVIYAPVYLFLVVAISRKHHPTEKNKRRILPLFFKRCGNIPFVRLFCFFYSPWPITAYLIRKILKKPSRTCLLACFCSPIAMCNSHGYAPRGGTHIYIQSWPSHIDLEMY